MMTDELHALILADAIGALDADEQLALQAELSALPPAAQDEAGRLYDTALLVAVSADTQEPPPELRARVIAAAVAPRNYTITSDSAWADSGHAGIEAKILAIDRERGLVTMLLRGQVGAIYPSHRHTTPEECYVLRGRISVGDLVLNAGDFHHANADSDHDRIQVLDDAEVLLVAGIEDYLPH